MFKFRLSLEESKLAKKCLNACLWKKTATMKHKIYRELISIFMWVPVGAAVMSAYKSQNNFILISVLLALLSLYFYQKVLNKLDNFYYTNWIKQNNKSNSEYEVTYNENEFQAKSGNITTTIPWSTIENIREENNFLFLYFSQDKAFIIPLENLLQNEEFTNFMATANKNT